jgi:hypothetical protein
MLILAESEKVNLETKPARLKLAEPCRERQGEHAGRASFDMRSPERG